LSLITDIKSIIATLYPDATLILSSKFKANLTSFNIDAADLPLVVIDNEQPKDSDIKKNNNVHKDTRIIISFLYLDSKENSDEQTNTLIEQAEAMADRVAVNIYQLLTVRPEGNQAYKITPMFHVFSTDLSGVALEIRVNYQQIVRFSLNQ